ncbi:MAG: hypothetical protein U9Q34_03350 [Elusimicrobiota bacterium]|nr:hypothetical protein [Elusimicrobiota bacterium]
MKKIGIALVAITMIMSVTTIIKAEGVDKGWTEDTLEENGIDWGPSQSEYQFPKENCCGQMVPAGTCMAACFDPGFNEPIKPLPIVNCCGGTDPNTACAMECYDDEGKPIIFLPLQTDYKDMQKTQTSIGFNAIENLVETNDKISSLDMDKDFGKAGDMLDSFYSGDKIKKSADSSHDYVDLSGWDTQSDNDSKQSEESICNAKASKITKLASKVAPLDSDKTEEPLNKNNKFPISAGVLSSGALALGLVKRKKGYFSNYKEDLDTVIDAVTNPVDTYNDFQAASEYNNSQSSGDNSSSSQNNTSGSSSNLSEGTTNYEVERESATTLCCDPTGTCTQ